MQRSRDCADQVSCRESTQRLNFADDVIKGDNRDPIDDSSTLVSNLSSEEARSIHSKCHATSHRMRIIILSIFFGFSLLGLGYWMGWVIGERMNSLNSPTIEINSLDCITISPLDNPTDVPSSKPEMSSNTAPIESDLTVSTSGTYKPSDSPIGSSVELATKSPTESPTTPANNSSSKPEMSSNTAPIESDLTVSTSGTYKPSDSPIGSSVELATKSPTESPTTPANNSELTTRAPTVIPLIPSVNDIEQPTTPPFRTSASPTTAPHAPMNVSAGINPLDGVTYIPGNLTRMQNNLLLSEGLDARIIAQTGKPVEYVDGSSSDINFHVLPDAGATFPDTRWWNDGGWIYVSNSEAKNENEGGVGAITFDKHGSVVHYRMVLENTYMNCGGGRTPWNTWVSCEEVEFTGQIYQVDPTGQRPSERMSLGSAGGRWESFAYDIRDKDKPRFFTTEDHNKGCTRRFTPEVTHWGGDEWRMLHEEGVLDYLFIDFNNERTGGTFEWTDDLEAAKNNARAFYPQSEGIDIQDGKMYIVCKNIQQLFVFDLDEMTFHNVSTVSGLFDGDPDQMQRILGSEGGLLYFTEEGGEDAGVHARDEFGRFFTILESPFFLDETTGLSFSPDGKHMYIAYQENGVLFDVTREDGLAFDAKSLDVKYHHSISSRRLNSQWIGR